jgi:hypothetical protein
MYGQRYQNAAEASREYAERFPERHHPGPHQYSGEIDSTGLKILENNKYIQSIIDCNYTRGFFFCPNKIDFFYDNLVAW